MALFIWERVKCVCFTVIMVCMFVSCTRQGTEGSLSDFNAYLAEELAEDEIVRNPENLIQVINDLSVTGSLSKNEAAYHRAMVYFDTAMDLPKAAKECFSILDSRFVRRNPKVHMMVYEILSQYYHYEKELKQSMEYAMRGHRIAQAQKDTVMQAVFSYNLIKAQIDLGSGYYYDELEELIPALEHAQEWFIQEILVNIYADEVGDLWDVEDYERVIDYGSRCLKVLDGLGKAAQLDEVRCNVASTLARSYVAVGQPEKAKAAFEQALHTATAQTRPGSYNLIGYYLDTDQLDSVPKLLNAPEDLTHFDAYTWANMVLLTDLQSYYDKTDQAALVEKTGMQMDVVRDSIVHREHHLQIEKATLMSEMNVDEMRSKLFRMQRYQQLLIVVLLVLLAISSYLTYFFFKEKKARNRKIVEMNDSFEALYHGNSGVKAQTDASAIQEKEQIELDDRQEVPIENLKEILARMDALILEEKLYLKESITRGEMALRLHVDKNLVILAIRTLLDDCTMPSLLNRYRVQHAIALMKSQPNYTVQAIAEDSGFSNVRKFYRIFKDEMGMTPTEYREAMESGEGSVLSPPPI